MSDTTTHVERLAAPAGSGRLPTDVCRCHDWKCHEKEQCLRWLDRRNGGTIHWVSHAMSLRSMEKEYPHDLEKVCSMRIAPVQNGKDQV